MAHFEMKAAEEIEGAAEEEEVVSVDPFYVTDFHEWITVHRLNELPAIMAWLDEIGAEAIDPLMYNAADLLEQARNALSPADFALYLRAGMCTRAFEAFEADEAQQWLKDLKSDAAEAAKKEAMEVKCKARLKEIDAQMIRIKKEATVDIAFVVDCTGSIIKHMVTIKTNIKEYVAKVQALHSMAQIRLAFIGYRDYGCKAQQILVLDFTVDLEAFAKMVDGIVCGGGMDDGPEDVLGGLKAASELSWTATHRFMYLIGDNPCHGTVYHNDRHSGHKKGHKDRYPKVEDEPKGLKAEEILAVIYDKNLHFSFCKVTSYTDIMITKFNGIFRGIIAAQPKELPGTGSSTSSESIDSAAKASEDYIKTLIVKDVNLIEIIVGTTLHSLTSSSLTASACTDSGKHVRMKDYVLNPTKPMSWPEKVIEAIEYPLRVPESVQEIVTAISTNSQLLCIDNYPRVCQYTMKLQECPFGLGAMKASFFGLLTDLAVPDESVLHVFKESKAEHVSKLTRREYEKFLLCHSVSTFLADLFTIQKPKQYPNVCFAEASLMELTSEHTTDSSEIFMIKEEYINAPYEKYNSNAGYVSSSPSVVWLTDHGVVQAFSHWTYQVTNGMLMVVDCQGGYDAKSRRFILTDPAIHCKNPLMFGKTNMQTKGMQNFFKSHKCNACCKEMGLFNPY